MNIRSVQSESKSALERQGRGWQSQKILLIYSIHLHIREKELIKGLAAYFNLDNLSKNSGFAIESSALAQHEVLQPSQTAESENIEIKHKYIDIRDKSVNFRISKYSDIVDVIIPFFQKYPIIGQKSLDFLDFSKVAELIRKKEHLTSEGFNKILKINSSMNLRRP